MPKGNKTRVRSLSNNGGGGDGGGEGSVGRRH